MTKHPYRNQPPRAFWSSAVTRCYSAIELATSDQPWLRADDRIASAGSCFAANVVPWLEAWGLEYVRTEAPHPAFAHLREAYDYGTNSAAYGNVNSARQLRQLLQRALGSFHPVEDRWVGRDAVVDPFRPGLRYPARTEDEFALIAKQHLTAVRRAFERATVVLVTLGLTEVWESVIDGAVFPACPGTIAGEFDSSRHRLRQLDVADVVADLAAFADDLTSVNPTARVVLTVSPVPLVATATAAHVVSATTYSKSVLRAAAEVVASSHAAVRYFPAYEIVTGPQAPHDYFAADRRSVSAAGIAAVMGALCATSRVERPDAVPVTDARTHASAPTALSEALITADCEEMAEEA